MEVSAQFDMSSLTYRLTIYGWGVENFLYLYNCINLYQCNENVYRFMQKSETVSGTQP